MSAPDTFSIAVVRGPSVGQVLRTDRKRIAVGRSDDNDLILQDREVALRHFLVLIDQGRWRIHTFSPDSHITVDRRWAHPGTGLRGAVVQMGGAELLLYPGHLEPHIIEREIQRRASGAPDLSESTSDLVTQVKEAPAEFGYEGENLSMPTIPVPKRLVDEALANVTEDDPELVKLSMLPTIAGERPPDDIREAARTRLKEERAPVAPSVLVEHERNQPVRLPESLRATPEEKTAAIGWDDKEVEIRPFGRTKLPAQEATVIDKNAALTAWVRAKQKLGSTDGKPGRNLGPDLRVIRTPPPEGQVAHLPEIQAHPNDADRKPTLLDHPVVPEILADAESEVRALPVVQRPEGQDGRERAPPKNAWGDPVSRASPPPKKPKSDPNERKNAWGDGARGDRNGRALLQVPRETRSLAPSTPTHVISVQDLAKRAVDPALAILQDPDGEFATNIRLFSTKLEEFMRTLGYRAYMMTSAEPLTGKTTAACNLAFALAEDTHRRVALVEANFRHPRLAEIFGIPDGLGLIPLLEGRVQIAETIVKMSDRNLVIMPSGGRYPHPGELLASPRFKMLIAELANTVDIAVIDAPPVSPFADANMLLPLLDAAVLVVAEGRTRVSWVAEAGKQLGMTRIIGGLYNRIPRTTMKEMKAELKERMTP
jgi:capsular exopolysaccharide synthesis family protein